MRNIVKIILWYFLPLSVAADGVSDVVFKELNQRFAVSRDQIKETPVDNLYLVESDDGIVYITGDGRYLLSGELIDLDKRINLTAISQNAIAKQLLSQIPDEDKIIFKAQKEQYVINVFTDVDCPFCQRLHSYLKDYNKLGITIKYLASPLTQLHPKAKERMEWIWCNKNRRRAMDIYKKTGRVTKQECINHSVAEQLKLSQKLGVTGTPTIFLPNGMRLAGAIRPEDLLNFLKQNF